MLFKLPAMGDLCALKNMTRKFEEFYLPSLEKLINTFERVALWCDMDTAKFLRERGLDKKIMMRVMAFSDLPHYVERDQWLQILESMRKNVGYLLRHKTPAQWIDYMILIAAKPAVMKWAADTDKFKSKYFMWIDAGSFNPMYNSCWTKWTGHIDAHPTRVRITVAPTLGKSRPHFVPKFIYTAYKHFCPPIGPATAETMAQQNLTDIAMINADYDVPAACFMIPKNLVTDFYHAFERTRRVMKKHNLVSTEQAVFQAMMKFDVDNLFEVSYIHGYTGVYTAVAAKNADHMM